MAADENFDNAVLRGLQRRVPNLDVVRIQDTQLYGADDPDVLEWITQQARILLTHDRRTMPRHYYDRVASGLKTPGMLLVDDEAQIGKVIDDLLIILIASEADEWDNQVVYIPLK